MAVGLIPSKVRSFFRRLLEKRRRRKASNCSSPLENEKPKHESASAPTQNANDSTAVPDSQLASPFLSWLPIEVRQMIYGLVWNGPYDHKYHNPRGRHVHFQDGHWTNTRCVMYEDDENLDFIQNNSMCIPRYPKLCFIFLPCGRLYARSVQMNPRNIICLSILSF